MAAQTAATRRLMALAVATVAITLMCMAAAVRGAAVTPPKCGNMPASACSYTYHDPTTSKTYVYDFSSLCSEDDYVFTDVKAHTYSANICGSTHKPCYPSGWTNTYVYGAATQFWGATPECKNPPACQDKQGNAVCCTADCQVLGVGTPIMSLIDPSNPETGGVRLRHRGAAGSASDPFWCTFNPATGAQYEREVTYDLLCDESVTGLAKPVSALQNVTNDCRYTLTFKTAKACGGPAPPPPPPPPPVTTTCTCSCTCPECKQYA